MKLFVLLSRLPYPLDKGDKLRAYHQIKALNERHEIILCCLSDERLDKRQIEAVKAICVELHVLPLQKFRIALNLFLSIFSRKPFQVHYFYQRRLHKRVAALIASHQPNHIFCQLVRTSEYVKHEHDYPKTIDYQDAFSKGMDRRAERSSWPLRELFNMERRRLVAYENIIFEYFEQRVIISEEDRRFIYHPERKDIHVVPNGIDTDYFSKDNVPGEKRYDLVFTGNMGYAPNVATAEYIVQVVLPILRKTHPHITLLLAGANPSRRVRALEDQKYIRVSGWMDDIRHAYASARIFFAPMQIGTGLQNKLLEAMAMGMPCVTTTLANKALKATHGEDILVQDDPYDMAEELVKLLNDFDLYDRLSIAGRAYVQKCFSWSASAKQMESIMTEANQKVAHRL